MLANPSKFFISGGQRNFHRFVRLSNSLVALSECDEQITGVDRSVTRDASRPRASVEEEKTVMGTQTLTRPKQIQTVEDKVQQLRQLYADAPQYAKTALE